ncbi:MAG: hypothetical protein R3342_03930 [Lutibacter sp.]|uniref:hypothetical protein n=1 Tax=Lutibacter sp. TaxID=1925666 RepID=UPI00299F2928|nr:hypothetical protein [Lutibacter sp.]MDX1828677.1 hypothetical protein [Lutibacter sp.]
MSNLNTKKTYFFLLYTGAILCWLVIWYFLDAFPLMIKEYKILWLPFLVSLIYLLSNLILNSIFWYVGPVQEEEELFNPINARLSNVFTAATAVLAIAALIYTIKNQPATREFVNFASYTFIFGLVSMLILWIPGNKAIWKFYFRHFQTILLIFSITLCMGSILILLENLSEII